MQHVVATHPQVPADDSGRRVPRRMADVESGGRGIGEHVKDIPLRSARATDRPEGCMLVPEALPARFHLAVVVPGRLGAACLASHESLLSLETKTPLQATGEALRARRGGARLGQTQGRGRSADLLHVADILAAAPVDVNSTSAEHGGLSLPHRVRLMTTKRIDPSSSGFREQAAEPGNDLLPSAPTVLGDGLLEVFVLFAGNEADPLQGSEMLLCFGQVIRDEV